MLSVSMNFIESKNVLSLGDSGGASRYLRIPSSGVTVTITVGSIKHLSGMKNAIATSLFFSRWDRLCLSAR